MTEAPSTTTWRDEPIVPESYEEVGPLIAMARKARRRIVKFDWAITPDELRRFRRDVFEYGSGVVGRYRCFDARVLAAINEALGEPNSVFARSEPRNSQKIDCQVVCIHDGEVFRLRGHASFDLVFGYAFDEEETTVEDYPEYAPWYRIAESVSKLGWDLERLREKRLGAVIHTLYGLAKDYGGSGGGEPHPGPPIDVKVHFHGPFSTVEESECRCLFTDQIAEEVGVYLWTINVGGVERPWYVGQTGRGFGVRTGEHIAALLSGQNTAYDSAALSRGEYQRSPGTEPGDWPHTLPSFLKNYEAWMPNIIALIRLVRIHVAPVEGDRHLYDRIEGAIARYYQNNQDRDLRDFLTPGLRTPARIPFNQPMRLMLSSDTPLAGMPQEILE